MDHRILVLDGNQRAALAVVRSLGSKGLWVAVGESSSSSLAGSSRFCSVQTAYSDPFSSPRTFFEDVLRIIQELGVSFLMPITEATTYVLLKYRSELPESLILPFPDSDTVERIANKNELFSLAGSKGVPIPETLVCSNLDEGLEALESSVLHYPIVLKPAKSKVLLADNIVSSQVVIANSREEAERALRIHPYFSFPFTIQRFVEGVGQGIFALFDHGKPVCYFAHRRLREKPPAGGVSVLSESAIVNETLRMYAQTLLQSVQWHGVAMVEFRVAQDGTGYLMEINPRFWGSLQLAIDSGIDFPWLLFQISTGAETADVTASYRRLRWLMGDLDRLYLVLKAPRSAYSLSQKVGEIFRFLRPTSHTRHEVNRVYDLRPFWFELKQYFLALRS